jgi:molybdopterin biosynthesis enzyme
MIDPPIRETLHVDGEVFPVDRARAIGGARRRDLRTPHGRPRFGLLLSMVRADGIAIIPEGWTHVDAGTRVRVVMLDWAEV